MNQTARNECDELLGIEPPKKGKGMYRILFQVAGIAVTYIIQRWFTKKPTIDGTEDCQCPICVAIRKQIALNGHSGVDMIDAHIIQKVLDDQSFQMKPVAGFPPNFVVLDDLDKPLTEEQKKAVNEQMERYCSNLERYLAIYHPGVKAYTTDTGIRLRGPLPIINVPPGPVKHDYVEDKPTSTSQEEKCKPLQDDQSPPADSSKS